MNINIINQLFKIISIVLPMIMLLKIISIVLPMIMLLKSPIQSIEKIEIREKTYVFGNDEN